jgi:hypothetical protein
MCLQISVMASLSGIDLSLIPRGIPFHSNPIPADHKLLKRNNDLATQLLRFFLVRTHLGMGASSLVTAISSATANPFFLQDLWCGVCFPLLSPALRVDGSGS